MRILKAATTCVVSLTLIIAAVVLLSIPISIYERPGDLLAVDNAGALLIDNVNVVDVVTGNVVPSRQISISGGVIVAINPAGTLPDGGATRIDAQGAFVTPGLFDMHVHIHDRKYLAANLAYGVTSVRSMRGLPMHLRWKNELANGEWLGSTLYTSSPVLDGAKYAHALQQVVTSPDEARRLVRKYQADGYDLIKAYGYLDKAVYEAIIDEATNIGFPVAKHGPIPVEGATIESNAGLQSLEHVEDIFQGPLEFGFEREVLLDWITQLKRIDPYLTPTLATFDHLTQLSNRKEKFIETLTLETINPLYKTINREFEVKRWLAADAGLAEWNRKVAAYLGEIARNLDEQEIKLLVGSDAGTLYMPAGTSTHREIALLTAAGISKLTVLQAATINAARAMNLTEQYGSVEDGKIADLVLVKTNPLLDLKVLANPQAVVKSGQWLSGEDIRALKESAKSPSNLYISLGRLLQDLLWRALG